MALLDRTEEQLHAHYSRFGRARDHLCIHISTVVTTLAILSCSCTAVMQRLTNNLTVRGNPHTVYVHKHLNGRGHAVQVLWDRSEAHYLRVRRAFGGGGGMFSDNSCGWRLRRNRMRRNRRKAESASVPPPQIQIISGTEARPGGGVIPPCFCVCEVSLLPLCLSLSLSVCPSVSVCQSLSLSLRFLVSA